MEGSKWEEAKIACGRCGRWGGEGWVEGADLVFRSKTNTADYHDEMNSEHFMEWFNEQLLPKNCGIILDNATSITTSKKTNHQQQLAEKKKSKDNHNISYDENNIKKTLLERYANIDRSQCT